MKEQVEVRTLKEGKYVLIDEEPCVIKVYLMQRLENTALQKHA